jgi:hypothetical protein
VSCEVRLRFLLVASTNIHPMPSIGALAEQKSRSKACGPFCVLRHFRELSGIYEVTTIYNVVHSTHRLFMYINALYIPFRILKFEFNPNASRKYENLDVLKFPLYASNDSRISCAYYKGS